MASLYLKIPLLPNLENIYIDGLNMFLMEPEKEKEREREAAAQMIENERKIQMFIFEHATDKIHEHERARESYAVIRRREVIIGKERKSLIEISVKNSWGFRKVMARLSKEYGFKYDGATKTWFFTGKPSKEMFIDMVSKILPYIRGLYVEGSIYQEVYNTLHKVVLPDPAYQNRKIQEELGNPPQKQTPKPLKAGDTFVPFSPQENLEPMNKIYKQMTEALKELKTVTKHLNALAQTFASEITAYTDGKVYRDKLLELGYEYNTMTKGFTKIIPKSELHEELNKLRDITNSNVFTIRHTGNGLQILLDEAHRKKKEERAYEHTSKALETAKMLAGTELQNNKQMEMDGP